MRVINRCQDSTLITINTVIGADVCVFIHPFILSSVTTLTGEEYSVDGTPGIKKISGNHKAFAVFIPGLVFTVYSY